MNKRILCVLMALMLLCPMLSALAYDPIYVDGNGNIVTVTPAPGGSSGSGGSSNPGYGGNSGVMAPVTDTPRPTDDPNAVPAWYYEPKTLTAAWRDERVTVLSLGSVVSTIKARAGKLEVSTCSLIFDVEVAPERKLAIISPSNAGTVRLFKSASSKSVILQRCTAGRIVPVLSTGKRFTLIHYDDCIGYVQTSVLNFVPAATDPQEMAYITVNGKTTSRATVKVRQKPSGNSRILAELPAGTHVAVFSTVDKWTEIEAGGYHCWILSEFLTTVDESEERELACYVPQEYEFVEPNAASVSVLSPAEATPMPTAVVLH